jgi:hypothetical protein
VGLDAAGGEYVHGMSGHTPTLPVGWGVDNDLVADDPVSPLLSFSRLGWDEVQTEQRDENQGRVV